MMAGTDSMGQMVGRLGGAMSEYKFPKELLPGKELLDNLYAGLDIDQQVKLFLLDPNGKFGKIALPEWFAIQDLLGAVPGTMIKVTLSIVHGE
jgi:hypothetical protein